ncbi:MAG TPA: DUF1178 family protein [Rhodocyclaceae bacterium]|nr:DUF1178 family protein [Rhodocyclaceae bacterium]
MIVLNLCCDNEHLFEGWFASAEAFDAQCARGMVSCPVCGSSTISRRPTAPYVNTGAAPVPARTPARTPADAGLPPEAAAALIAVLRRAARESEDVGERFVEEARRIHYGEQQARNIKGKASGEDIGELLEEGILVLPVPPDDSELH